MNAEDPLFILYTSGSTGKPKGVLHTTGGYLVYASYTHEAVFDLHEDDIYWCTADVGWVTGHSYIVYGPLANGATALVFEGVPNYPTVSRFWEVIDKHKVTIFYTAPTAIRALMREGEAPVQKTSRKSLRLLGTVGEADQSGAWRWYYEVVGDARCPVVDHVVADRNRRHSDHAAAGRDRSQAGSRRPSRSSACSPRWSMPMARCSKARPKANLVSAGFVAGPDAHGVRRPSSASSRPTSRPIPACTSPATAVVAMPMAITGSRAASTT
jgi:acyl-CoA synthetase (AMP-forming)/AMP-acid ligase II